MSEPSPDTAPFPPEQIGAFLRLCAGEWMSLRSQFALGAVDAADSDSAEDLGEDGEAWHSSERGELVVAFLEAEAADGAGGLQVGPKDGVAKQQLHFDANGGFSSGEQQGRWQLWPDGSLELVITGDGREVRERIWFTKPNLRLRSTVETSAAGSPGRASFSSEIRRVSRPTVPAS
ncbi:phycobiliprotein lyase [Cyanobium sp. T1G-Tous]|uniref:phycobiliprotein lyase n=1 Tax=unclassified Cyanobium TaxID=2627006 RepID=UPI0020CF88FA|nr:MULTISPECIES: phycobiliprotein lyase [unclassified Cyanobium]MCP9779041.1 phycobiliprotein lyase [Cyanobium sp. Tous-M-B4]MCP9803674.1 phycobiliprotein lyase [Cyanobium sp. T1G-Tous]MCP9877537.1 phycobiliprotein lyase [Cyanobium sp. A2C-AMD]